MISLLEQIKLEVNSGRVREFKNNDYPNLSGFNYTESCQFGKEWNEINSQCRGIIFEESNCIARPFSKFFNIEEISEDLENKEIDYIQNKEDGSLIISYLYQDEIRFATRGSFHSEQAMLAQKIWNEKYNHKIIDRSFFKEKTLLFELIGPSNINVSRGYQEDNLILLGMIDILSGLELPISEVDYFAEVILGCPRPKIFSAKTVKELYSSVKEDKNPSFEGVVVTFKDGLKVKIKSYLYIELHKIITGSPSKDTLIELWKEYSLSRQFVFLKNMSSIPDEYFEEIKGQIRKIDDLFNSFSDKTNSVFAEMLGDYNAGMPRKDMALKWIDHRWLLSPLFSNDRNVKPILQKVFIKGYMDGDYQ